MKKGQVFEGVIEKVAFPNKGHITVDGKTVIVKNGVHILPAIIQHAAHLHLTYHLW